MPPAIHIAINQVVVDQPHAGSAGQASCQSRGAIANAEPIGKWGWSIRVLAPSIPSIDDPEADGARRQRKAVIQGCPELSRSPNLSVIVEEVVGKQRNLPIRPPHTTANVDIAVTSAPWKCRVIAHQGRFRLRPSADVLVIDPNESIVVSNNRMIVFAPCGNVPWSKIGTTNRLALHDQRVDCSRGGDGAIGRGMRVARRQVESDMAGDLGL